MATDRTPEKGMLKGERTWTSNQRGARELATTVKQPSVVSWKGEKAGIKVQWHDGFPKEKTAIQEGKKIVGRDLFGMIHDV